MVELPDPQERLLLHRTMSEPVRNHSHAVHMARSSSSHLRLLQILHAAAAPLRAGVGGAAVVVRQWTQFARVCIRCHSARQHVFSMFTMLHVFLVVIFSRLLKHMPPPCVTTPSYHLLHDFCIRSWRQIMLAEPVAVAIGLDRWPAVCNWLATTQVGVVHKPEPRKGYLEGAMLPVLMAQQGRQNELACSRSSLKYCDLECDRVRRLVRAICLRRCAGLQVPLSALRLTAADGRAAQQVRISSMLV